MIGFTQSAQRSRKGAKLYLNSFASLHLGVPMAIGIA